MQFGKISTILNLNQQGILLSNTVQNPKNDVLCLALTTQSVKSTVDPPLPIVDVPKNDSIMVDETPTVESDKVIGVDISIGEDTCKGKVYEPKVKKIP